MTSQMAEDTLTEGGNDGSVEKGGYFDFSTIAAERVIHNNSGQLHHYYLSLLYIFLFQKTPNFLLAWGV
jgi:hypothetical protein